MIDLKNLPKEIVDTLLMKEANDSTFTNALSEDYTDILFDTLEERRNKKNQQSFIATFYGRQGCWSGNTNILVKKNNVFQNIPIKDIEINDIVLSFNGKDIIESLVSKKFCYKNTDTIKLSLKYGENLILTPEHKLFTFDGNNFIKKKISEFKKGDFLLLWKGKEEKFKVIEIIDIQKHKYIDVYDIHVPVYNNYILSNGLLSSNSGKSYTSLSLSAILDPRFNINNIFFDVENLVNNKHKLRENDCVLVDEMARGYGIDSNRINIMIQTIKEQLRKKSIHMFYCSPTLKDEYKSSQYVFETMFIDKEEQLSFNAYKTNELLTLGYVIVPHPLNFVTKKLLLQYERKKDEHLKEVLEGPIDAIEDRAQLIIKNPVFIKANKMYCKARGYIPYKILVQIVEKIYPEFKGSVIVYEVADRIKCDLEISGKWIIHGSKGKEE